MSAERRLVLAAASLAALLAVVEDPLLGRPPFSPFQQISMGADLLKPYTEIEYMGVIYPLVELKGGHNGSSPTITSVVAKCRTNPPVFDPGSGLWRVPVTNSLVQFSADDSPFGRIRIGALDGETEGYLEFPPGSGPVEALDFPVRSAFTFRVAVELPDLGLSFFSEQPVTVTADNLSSWPPPVGTVYVQNQVVDLVAVTGGPTVARLRPDTTIITGVFQPGVAIPTLSPLGWIVMAGLLCGAVLLLLSRRRLLDRPPAG